MGPSRVTKPSKAKGRRGKGKQNAAIVSQLQNNMADVVPPGQAEDNEEDRSRKKGCFEKESDLAPNGPFPQDVTISTTGPLWQGKPAVFHHDLRDSLIAAASAVGKYVPERVHGRAGNDVTSYLPSQQGWGTERSIYPPIIFQYEPPAVPHNPTPTPTPTPVQWEVGDRVVLDREGMPMRFFADLPHTIASNITGCEIEAIRRTDQRIIDRDIWSRMPYAVQMKDGEDHVFWQKPVTLLSLASRAKQFRKNASCIAWKANPGTESKKIKEFMDKRLTAAGKANNSTKDIGDLSKEERKALAEHMKKPKHDGEAEDEGEGENGLNITVQDDENIHEEASVDTEDTKGEEITRHAPQLITHIERNLSSISAVQNSTDSASTATMSQSFNQVLADDVPDARYHVPANWLERKITTQALHPTRAHFTIINHRQPRATDESASYMDQLRKIMEEHGELTNSFGFELVCLDRINGCISRWREAAVGNMEAVPFLSEFGHAFPGFMDYTTNPSFGGRFPKLYANLPMDEKNKLSDRAQADLEIGLYVLHYPKKVT